MRQNNGTKAWELYEQGRRYNNSLVPNQYRLVNTNIDFFAGNQWRNIPQTEAMARLPKPVFNIIKRVTSLFVASLTSARFKLQFFPLSDYAGGNVREPEENAAAFATAEVENLLEKFKMEYRVREALYDGAQTGDYCAHFWWDPDAAPYGGAEGHRGEIQMELVDGINVMFGNPNDARVEQQPYILLLGRAPVEQLREEMRRWKAKGEIYADRELKEQAGIGGKTELEGSGDEDGKALYVYLYTKVPVWEPAVDAATGEILQEPVFDKNGDAVLETDEKGNVLLDAFGEPVVKTRDVMRRVERVHVTKATRDAVIFEDVDTGLSRYPIAWGNWERQKNQYHGRALVTGLVPNQIFINMMFAMAMRHLQLMGFPKTVYNADLIGNWSNEIGQAIGVRGLLGDWIGRMKTMKKLNVQKLTLCGVMAALVFVMTYFPKIPVPVTGGYVHLGDGAIFLSVLLLGPLGIPAAAVGSMLSDLIGGYMVYVLPTFLIKGLVALVAWKLCRKDQPLLALLSFLLAEAVMVLGYFLLEWALYGVASAAAAIGPNVVQGIAGVLIGMLCLLIAPRLERVAKV